MSFGTGNPIQLLVSTGHSLLGLKSFMLPMHHLEPKANAHPDLHAPPAPFCATPSSLVPYLTNTSHISNRALLSLPAELSKPTSLLLVFIILHFGLKYP